MLLLSCGINAHLGRFRASVPSGASTGIHEAVELRDGDKNAYVGKGVSKAVKNVNDIIGLELVKSGLQVTAQKEIDDFLIKLDGTPNKGKLGANAILGVSIAVAEAGAAEKGVPLYQHLADLAGVKPPFVLPTPAFNVINGGSHAGNKLAFQEFMLLPTGATTFTEALKIGTETYHTLKKVISAKYGIDAVNVGDEGGFAPNVSGAEESLELLSEAIKKAGYEGKIKIALDVASSEFYKEGKYDLDFKNPNSDPTKWISGVELADLYLGYIKKYPIVSIEDPFDQDDWEAWSHFTSKSGIQIVGDDLTVTNPLRIKTAIEKKACNGLLLKVNQIGTISESIQAAQLAQSDGWGVMVSHRSGETENTVIADLVVALGVGQIKTGAPARSERVAKYNALLRIEEEIGDGVYAGEKGLSAGSEAPALIKNINVAAGPSNIPRPVINPGSSTAKGNDNKKRRPKRKRIASEPSTSVAGDPPVQEAQTATTAVAPQPAGRVQAHGSVAGDEDHSVAEDEIEVVWSAPWLERLGTTSYDSKEQRLHDEIVAFYQYISPSPEEAHVRAMVIKLVSDSVQRRFPQGTVDTFGSVAQNLYLPDGDTDMVVTMPESYDDPETKKRTLFQLSALMRHNHVAAHVQVIHRARVPVISFQTLPDLGALKIDISLNASDGVKAVSILRDYFTRMPALRFLVLCLKSLLTRHGLNAASGGGLSSYGVICLAISFLQLNPLQRPAAFIEQPLESESLGVLLVDFLEYYGKRFDYETAVVSVTQGKVLTKEEKGWTNTNYPHAVCIECLIKSDNDVGRPTSKVGRIRTLFQESHAALKAYAFSDAPAAYNVLGTVLGVSDMTLGHRALLRDVVSSGRLEQALREVQVSVEHFTTQPRRPPQGQQSYPRYNSRPSGHANGNGANATNANANANDRPRNSGNLPQRPPVHPSLPPRPTSGQAQQKKGYVPQGPSFGALRAAAAATANGKGKEGNGNATSTSTPPKPDAKAGSGSNGDANAAASKRSSPGERSPPRRRRKAQ
ncbi:hypothetical protein V8D89_006427 [Ganoderma adspersum]